MDEIKLDIETQIEKINKAFSNYWGKLFYDGLLDEDIETLEILLMKVSKNFKAYNRLSIISTIFLIVILLFGVFDILKFGKITMNINLLGLIVMMISILKSTYTFYKLKVNLENKIFLLGLLNKIEQK